MLKKYPRQINTLIYYFMSVSYFFHESKTSVLDGHVPVDSIKIDNLFYSESLENKKKKYARNK